MSLIYTNVDSFRIFNYKKRSHSYLKSHFSTIETTISDKNLLIQSLHDLYPKNEINIQDTVITEYGQNKKVNVSLLQENNHPIGFQLKNGRYHLVADLGFWGLPQPPELFLEKLTQQYSLNNVLEVAKESHYDVNYVKKISNNYFQVQRL